jgi:hypothetical protein
MIKLSLPFKFAVCCASIFVVAGCEPTYTQAVVTQDGREILDVKHRYNNVLPPTEISRFERLSNKAISANFTSNFVEQIDVTMYVDETVDSKMWCGTVDIEGLGKRDFGYVTMQNRRTKQVVAIFGADRDSCMKSLWENSNHPEFSAQEQ